MKFLSEEGLDYLVSKLKSLFATESKVEHLKEKVKKINTPMQTVARKAIRLGSAGKNVRYYHRAPTIVLPDGRYQFVYLDKETNQLKYLELLESRGHNTVTNTGGDRYEVSCINKEKWGNLYFLDGNIFYGRAIPYLIEVKSVVIQKDGNGKGWKVVTLDIQEATEFTGNTASPYLYIHRGILGGSGKCLGNLPFEDIFCNKFFNGVKTYTKKEKNKVYLYVKYYNKQYSEYCPVLKTRKYHLVNRMLPGNTNKQMCHANHKRGDAIVKWYRKGVVIATRNIYFNGKTKKFRA